ncbi:MAG TPA: LysR family transcriptional regulator [Bryobacteraceae bacterium]|nr:LysR family transcriptional regulator [Bryobacteraceae bacterium]
MDFRALEMFVAVADNSSFTLAGQQLHVSQSAISRKIRLLEEELGQGLFNRVGKRICLTEAGNRMLRHARRVFQVLREASLEISEVGDLKRGLLRVGSGMTACMYMLPPVLEKFKLRYPDIDVFVTTSTTEVLVEELRNGRIDLGLLTLPVNAPGLESVPVTTEELVVVVSPKHPGLSRRRFITVSELAHSRLILHDRSTSVRSLVDRFFQEAGINPQIVMEAETVATIKPLVQINLGMSILPLCAVEAEARRGELAYLRIRDYKLTRPIGVVFQRSEHQPRLLSELIALFQSSEAAKNSYIRVR